MRHAFEQAITQAHGKDTLLATEVETLFERRVKPSLHLAARIGPMHTNAIHVNLCSSLLHAPSATSIGMFSFGSGAAASMYSYRLRGEICGDKRILNRLNARTKLSREEFAEGCARYMNTYGRFNWAPDVRDDPEAPSFRLARVDALGRRWYEHRRHTVLDIVDTCVGVEHNAHGVVETRRTSGASTDRLQQILSLLAVAKGNAGESLKEVSTIGTPVPVREVARALIGEAVSVDAPLMEAGLDSLGATEFRSRLAREVADDVTLPETLVFDFPTLRQIEAYVASSCCNASSGRITAHPGGKDELMSLLASLAEQNGGQSHSLEPPRVVPVCEVARALMHRANSKPCYTRLVSLSIVSILPVFVPEPT